MCHKRQHPLFCFPAGAEGDVPKSDSTPLSVFLLVQSSVEGDVQAHVAAKPVKPTKADVLELLQELLKQHFPRAARQVS